MMLKISQLAFLVLLSPPHRGGTSKGVVARAQDPLPLLPQRLPLQPEFLDAPQEPSEPLTVTAHATTCPAGNQFVKTCIDSSMNYENSRRVPPDPHGAVGTTSLVAVTNTLIEGLRKDGTSLFLEDLHDMFAPLNPTEVFDPKVVWDVHRGRFVVVVMDRAFDKDRTKEIDSNIMLAVSKTGDPTTAFKKDWYLLKMNAFIDGTWADYPGLAVDEEAIYVTSMQYPAGGISLDSSLLWIIAKIPFYDGGTASWAKYDYVRSSSPEAVHDYHMPAMVRSPTGIAPNVGTYLVAHLYASLKIQVIQINDPLGTPTFQHASLGSIGAYVMGDAPQLGSNKSLDLDTGTERALQAVWVNNQLWTIFTIGDSAGRASAYWVKLNDANGVTFPPTLADQGYINGEDIGPDTYTFYPSIDVNSKGIVAIGFAASSANMYGSAYATFRDDTRDAAGTTRKPDLVRAGLGPYASLDTYGRNRWGDYTATALDPAEEDCFWVYNEYAGPNSPLAYAGKLGEWKTTWVKLCLKAPCGLHATQPCVYNPSANVCCGSLVCRKTVKPKRPFQCRKCSKKGQPCLKNYYCCSKKCKRIRSKHGLWCK